MKIPIGLIATLMNSASAALVTYYQIQPAGTTDTLHATGDLRFYQANDYLNVWAISPVDGGATIKNAFTNINSYISCDDTACASVAQQPTTFTFEDAGAGAYRVCNPADGLVWTAADSTIKPAPADGSQAQKFVFQPVQMTVPPY
ncbi:hypothetical protein ASPACDRAFT_1859561 [Aspergillus aculeatus ATCC 16872]|uniref:Ricin B lectin domain-containing protein n=1 Tax=Aspergillus aculeatus (strain ATCC 16872 / CBS 172.66 / WB 5094) TaxID=690307 RepID=A0A1L9WJK2_ASPA1|nr:uncharacterized protein ASPACDRAFT_1859561 [Aspergillus aculeatus ATCC 16872]OJJ96335.1 hypothetical protein ASPACDRAFT_1859561 [Aspergillus aculeatus ATCC 16872]